MGLHALVTLFVCDSSNTETSLTKPEIANFCDEKGEV